MMTLVSIVDVTAGAARQRTNAGPFAPAGESAHRRTTSGADANTFHSAHVPLVPVIPG